MPLDPIEGAVDIGGGWSVAFMVEVPCAKSDPEDWDACPIVGHGPGHYDTVISADRARGNRRAGALCPRTQPVARVRQPLVRLTLG